MEAVGRLDHDSFDGMVGELLYQMGKSDLLVVALCGRGQSPARLLSALKRTIECQPSFLVLAPSREWYPLPNSPNDQEDAVKGAQASALKLSQILFNLHARGRLRLDRTVLIGHSAGAVLALSMAAQVSDTYLAIVAHKGCLLDPRSVIRSCNSSPILMVNSRDDEVFGFDARVQPTYLALKRGNFRLTNVELPDGGHELNGVGLKIANEFIASTVHESTCILP